MSWRELAGRLGCTDRVLRKWRAREGAPDVPDEGLWRAWIAGQEDMQRWARRSLRVPDALDEADAVAVAEDLPESGALPQVDGLDRPATWSELHAARKAQLVALQEAKLRREVVSIASVRVAYRATIAVVVAELTGLPGLVAREVPPAQRQAVRKAAAAAVEVVRGNLASAIRTHLAGLGRERDGK